MNKVALMWKHQIQLTKLRLRLEKIEDRYDKQAIRLLKAIAKYSTCLVFVTLCSLSQLHAQTGTSLDSLPSSKAQLTAQCTETAKTTGIRCKIKVEEGKLFCRIHDPSTPRCGRPTGKDKKGPPCRITTTEGKACGHHARQ